MTYLVVDVDGSLSEHAEPATPERIREHVGEPGYDWVVSQITKDMAAFVNDLGFVQGLSRNRYGQLMLASTAFPIAPYAGPIVLVGWKPDGYPTEITDLSPAQVAMFQAIHNDLRIVLDNQPGEVSSTGWAMQMLGLDAELKLQPDPTIEVLTGDAAADLFRRMGR